MRSPFLNRGTEPWQHPSISECHCDFTSYTSTSQKRLDTHNIISVPSTYIYEFSLLKFQFKDTVLYVAETGQDLEGTGSVVLLYIGFWTMHVLIHTP